MKQCQAKKTLQAFIDPHQDDYFGRDVASMIELMHSPAARVGAVLIMQLKINLTHDFYSSHAHQLHDPSETHDRSESGAYDISANIGPASLSAPLFLCSMRTTGSLLFPTV
jgi:hypothetical protein